MEKDEVKKEKRKCKHCGFVWGSKSTRMYVSCPNCLQKVKEMEARK